MRARTHDLEMDGRPSEGGHTEVPIVPKDLPRPERDGAGFAGQSARGCHRIRHFPMSQM